MMTLLLWCYHSVQLVALWYVAKMLLQMDELGMSSIQSDFHSKSLSSISPTYGRVVVVMVDALRADFVFEREEMLYLRQMIQQDIASAHVSYAQTPTVTMPRIKALTTGGIPKFIDLIHNLDSADLREENIIEGLKSKGSRLFLFGDDTWLKLFPNQFVKTDGTTSFFASDYTEVDENVTRHIQTVFDPTMTHEDAKGWDGVILHYLGLDHVGHLLGPQSTVMSQKLREMDNVIEQIHRNLIQQQQILSKSGCGEHNRIQCDPTTGNALPTLFVVLSDHGMNQVGNHGGASKLETSAFLMMSRIDSSAKSPKSITPSGPISHGTIMQIDIAPTLATLFGLPIPKQNMGRIIDGAFSGNEARMKNAKLANAQQLLNLLEQHGEYSEDWSTLHQQNLDDFLNSAQQTLIDRSSLSDDSNTFMLYACCVVLFTCSFFVFVYRFNNDDSDAHTPGVFMFAIYPIAMMSSSMIENEHTFWFFGATTLFMHRLSSQHSMLLQILAVLVSLRLLHSRCQIINFARLANVSEEPVFVNEGVSVLVTPDLFEHWAVIVAAYLYIFVYTTRQYLVSMKRLSNRSRVAFVALYNLAGCLLINMKLPELQFDIGIPTTWQERFVLLVVLGGVGMASYIARKWPYERHAFLRLFVASLLLSVIAVHRLSNTLIIAIIIFMCRLASSIGSVCRVSVKEKLVFSYILGQCGFFALGNSHSISTIDLSGAFFGLSAYNEYIVGFWTFFITYSALLLALLLFLFSIMGNVFYDPRDLKFAVVMLRRCASYRIFMMTVTVVLMRNHLFAWSVFVPKWLYEVGFFITNLIIVGFLDIAAKS